MRRNISYAIMVIIAVIAFIMGFYAARIDWTAVIPAQQEEGEREWNQPFKMDVFGPIRSEGDTGVKVYWEGNTATVVERFMTDCGTLSLKSARYYIDGNTIHIFREFAGGDSGGDVRMNCVWTYEMKYVFYGLDRNYEFLIGR